MPGPEEDGNYFNLASKTPRTAEEIAALAAGGMADEAAAVVTDLLTEDSPVLRDDYAPVEWMMDS